jgi:hypothetical protein
MLRKFQRILDVYVEVPDRVLNLGMSEQYLDCTKIAGRIVDHRGLRASKTSECLSLRVLARWQSPTHQPTGHTDEC